MTDITAIRVDDEENVVVNLTDRLDSDLTILATIVLASPMWDLRKYGRRIRSRSLVR